MINISNKIKPIHLFIICFLFSMVTGLFFFQFVIPNIPGLYVSNLSMTPDSYYFNDVAIKMAQDVNQHGWTSWSLYPAIGAAGQSSFLAIFYILFGVNPLYVIPFNAFFHALSAILIYLIAIEVLGPNQRLNYFALLSAALFIIFPSSMSWVGQINKEACLNSGFLLGLWGIIKIISGDSNTLSILKYSIIFILSVILIATMKPYMLQILALLILCLLFMQLIRALPFNLKSFCLLIFYLLLVSNTFFLIYKTVEKKDSNITSWITGNGYIQENPNNDFKWKKTPLIPDFIDLKLNSIASARAAFISHGLAANAHSMIDTNYQPSSFVELLKYSPRALKNAIFSPFPNKWFKSKNFINFFSSLEMLFYYFIFFGLFFFPFRNNYNCSVLICCIFAIIPLTIIGLTIPNIGTTFRVRYPFEMIFLLLGVCGWAHLIKRWKLIN